MNIYISNISFKASEDELRELFEEYGEVSSAKIILDKDTQRSRGFGFVEMPDDASARTAITELNGFSLVGKDLSVSEARPKTERTNNYSNRNNGGGYGTRRQGGW